MVTFQELADGTRSKKKKQRDVTNTNICYRLALKHTEAQTQTKATFPLCVTQSCLSTTLSWILCRSPQHSSVLTSYFFLRLYCFRMFSIYAIHLNINIDSINRMYKQYWCFYLSPMRFLRPYESHRQTFFFFSWTSVKSLICILKETGHSHRDLCTVWLMLLPMNLCIRIHLWIYITI